MPSPPGPPRDVRAERGGAASWVPAPPVPAAWTCPLKERGPAPHRGHQDTRLFSWSIFISPFACISLHWSICPSSPRRFGRAGPCSGQCFSAFWEPRWWPVSGRGGLFSTADSASLCVPHRRGHLGWRTPGEKEGSVEGSSLLLEVFHFFSSLGVFLQLPAPPSD